MVVFKQLKQDFKVVRFVNDSQEVTLKIIYIPTGMSVVGTTNKDPRDLERKLVGILEDRVTSQVF